MDYEIEVTKDTDGNAIRIEGFCYLKGWESMVSVISFNTLHGKWITGGSMCLPSDIEDAKRVHRCVMAAFKKLDEFDA